MISSLEIKNYRGFEHYKIDSLAPVNLFVGKNNTGKTSILEALQLYYSKSPLSSMTSIAKRREETTPGWLDMGGNITGEFADIRHQLYGHLLYSGAKIEIIGGKEKRIILSLQEITTQDFQLNSEIAPASLEGSSKIIDEGIVSENGVVFNQSERGRQLNSPLKNGSIFVSSNGFNISELMDLYTAVVEGSFENALVSSLNIVNKEISVVFFLPNGRAGPGRILVGNQAGHRNPLGSYGDGMRRLLGIAMAFVNISNGPLLVDEVDSGLHYSVMPDLWNLIIGTSERLAVQTYLTTHSLDCVRGLRDALNLAPNMADQVAVHKLDRRLDYAISFTGSQLINALNGDVELR